MKRASLLLASALAVAACSHSKSGGTGTTPDGGGTPPGGTVDGGVPGPDGGSSDGGSGDDGGVPHPPNPVVDGQVRFTVLRDGLIRVEYAADEQFLDAPSFIALDRTPGDVAFSTESRDGWRRVTTARGTVRYRLGSGRFGADNLVVETTSGGQPVQATPRFVGNTCIFGQTCEAEDGVSVPGTDGGGPTINSDHMSYTGAGFAQTWSAGSSLTWRLADLPVGSNFDLTVRYGNASGGAVGLAWIIDGGASGTVQLPALATWDDWSTVTLSATSTQKVATLHLVCPAGTASPGCRINVDNIAVVAHGQTPAPALPVDTTALGGWMRGLDQQKGPLPLHPGLLSTRGWSLVNDSSSPLFNGTHVPLARPHADPDHQDGFLFLYDRDYAQALADLATLTGPATLPPRWAFGVLYCRYYAFHDTDWKNTIVPTAHTKQVPLDAIILDTDFKGPAQWNGWSWNTSDYPDPAGFQSWVHAQGLELLYNVHPSIQTDDPDYAAANAAAGPLLDVGNGRRAFDLSRQADVDAFLALGVNHTSLQQGFQPWLDWCCDEVVMSTPGIPEDSWFSTLYADALLAHGYRGKTWGRIGSRLTYYSDNRATLETGPWSDHRDAIHFTGDVFPTWDMMAFEAEFTASEASIGMPWVSHDIGSFHGGHLDDDMYVRWVQLGAFQPMLRLHSDHGDRLPWEYDATAEAAATRFFRLREAMLPYNYTVARQATTTGMAMARPLWLAAPDDASAYQAPTEYLWGDSLLVAPVAKAGTSGVQTSVYLPPGSWVGFVETGMKAQTWQGGTTVNVTTDLTSMPVFARSGAIIPMQPYADRGGSLVATALTIDVFAGADGHFDLYEDGGDGLDYQMGISTTTAMTWQQMARRFAVAARAGSFATAAAARSYAVRFVGVDAPGGVSVDGAAIGQSGNDSYAYDAGARILTVTLASRATSKPLAIVLQ